MSITSSFSSFDPLSYQRGVYPDHRRSEQYDKQGRKYEKREREDEFYGGLGGGLLRHLASLGPERVGMHAQRPGQARAELVGLDQKGRQRLDVLNPGPLAQVPERVRPGLSGPYLPADR